MADSQARKQRVDRLLRRWILVIPLSLLAVSTIYPIFFTFNVALKTPRDWIMDRFALSVQPTLENFPRAWVFGGIGQYSGTVW